MWWKPEGPHGCRIQNTGHCWPLGHIIIIAMITVSLEKGSLVGHRNCGCGLSGGKKFMTAFPGHTSEGVVSGRKDRPWRNKWSQTAEDSTLHPGRHMAPAPEKPGLGSGHHTTCVHWASFYGSLGRGPHPKALAADVFLRSRDIK